MYLLQHDEVSAASCLVGCISATLMQVTSDPQDPLPLASVLAHLEKMNGVHRSSGVSPFCELNVSLGSTMPRMTRLLAKIFFEKP